jgi:hypothetical protein
MTELSGKIANLQLWLNNKGTGSALLPLTVDGIPTPVLRDAIIETFRNRNAPAITQPEINQFADRLGCSPRQLATVAAVESGGAGWDDSGLLKCLYERHYLWRRIRLAVPLLSDAAPGGYTVDADRDGINDSWEKLADAAMRWSFGTAFECASFGKFQIMGAWWRKLGYPSVADFVWEMSRGERAHYEALCRYIEVNGLVAAVRAIDGHPANCLAFARGYNGKGQKGYDSRLAERFRRLA